MSKNWYSEEQIKRDMKKNEYCLNNNIPLYRIPYKFRDNITEVFENLEQFRVKEINHYHLEVGLLDE
jgi:hypothetical protein